MAQYTVILDPEPDGSAFTVTVPTLPGCITWGASIDAATSNAEEAIRCHLRGLVQDGQFLPIERLGLVIARVDVSIT